ncbi:MucR family transcriptional regulator [Schaalia sp. 19OD2882]|uniref:MucR family transcriptional regulator n=1 Tax=Schaalia sp. 19OD2882 TaxID=2794089 RepID=UPI0034655330
MHYKRRWKGRLWSGPALGAPAGAGEFGILDETDDGLLCHECGRRFEHLAAHVRPAHGLTAAEYRDLYGLPRGTPLVTSRISAAHSERARRVDSAGYLDGHRDPTRASHSRGPDAIQAVSRSRMQRGSGGRRT